MKKRNVFSPDVISTRSGNLVPMRKGFKQYNIGELPGWRDFENAKRQEFKVTILKPYKVKFMRDFYSPQKFQIDERFPIMPTKAAKLFPKAPQQRNIGRVLSLKEFKCVKTSEKRRIPPEDLFGLSSQDNEENSIELDDNPMTALFSHRSLEREHYRNSISPKLQNKVGKESSWQKKTLGKVSLEDYSGSQFITQNEINLTQSKSSKHNQASFNSKKASRENKYRSVTPVIENEKSDKESCYKESAIKANPTASSKSRVLRVETLRNNPQPNYILNEKNPKLRQTRASLSPQIINTKSQEEAEQNGLKEFYEMGHNKTPSPISLTPESFKNDINHNNESYDRKQSYKKESSLKTQLVIEVKNKNEKLLDLKQEIEKNEKSEEVKLNTKSNIAETSQKEKINLKMLSPQEQRNRPRSSTQNSSDAVFSPRIVVTGDNILKEQPKTSSSIKSPRHSEMIIRQKTNLYENIERSPRAIVNKEMNKKTDQVKSGESKQSHQSTTKKSSPVFSKSGLENQKSKILSDFTSHDQKNDFEGSQGSSKRIITKQGTEISLKSSNNESETGKIGPETYVTKKRLTNQTKLDNSKSLKPDEPNLEKKKTLMIESKSLNRGLSYKMSIRITGAPDSNNKIEGSQIGPESSFDKSEIDNSQNTSYLRAEKSRKPSAHSDISSRGSSRSAYLSTSKQKLVADGQKSKNGNANNRGGKSFIAKNTLRNNNLAPSQRLNQDSSLSSDSSYSEDVLDLPGNQKKHSKHSKHSLIMKQIEADKKFLKKMQTLGKLDTIKGSAERQSTIASLKKNSGISKKGLNIFKNFLLIEFSKKPRTMDPASNFIYNFSFSILKCMNGLIKLNTFKRLSKRISVNKKKLQSIRIKHEIFERDSLIKGKLKVNKKFSVRKESLLKIKIPTIKDQPKIKPQAKSPQAMYSREVALRVMHSPNSPEFKATQKYVEGKNDSSSDANSESESYSDSDLNSNSSRSSSLANLDLPNKFWKKSLIVDLTRQEITLQIAKEMIRQLSIGKSDDKSSISSQSQILDEESDSSFENDIDNDIKNLASKLEFSPDNFNFSSKVEFKTPKPKKNLVDFKEVMGGYFEVDYENLLRNAEKNIFCGILTHKQTSESKGLLISNDEALTDDQMFKNRVKKLRLTLKNHKIKLKHIKEKLGTESRLQNKTSNEEEEKSVLLERFCSEAYSEFEGDEYRESIYKRLKEALEKSTKEKSRITNPNVRTEKLKSLAMVRMV
ncbi:hypothetical protein SteCoe_18059 [Stentor coeruleus]|uniref:Uncharacterized protein n=1 Tax=Stentor coeruleus TaxID=5963 RepID=A0A1R2BXF4_9CILI|nr:hypothetical protein SteCoe_18059 [Stentor coeruleus]